MTFFTDLTPHTYTSREMEDGVLNIGWLGDGHAFPIGDCPAEFIAALESLCLRPINLHRGFHVCEFCSGPSRDNERPLDGNGQIRVCASNGIWYCAPTMVYHYVTGHHYLPPQEFIDAVLKGIAVAIEPERIKYWPR